MNKKTIYKVIRPLFVIYFKIRYNPLVIGKNNVPHKGKAILIANHTNNMDFISMGLVTKRNVSFLAKNTLFKGLLKYILNWLGVIPVDRTIKDKSVLKNAVKVLDEGGVVGIFPEGTFNKTTNTLAPFKIGAVKLSYDTSTPIIPIAITGKYRRGKLTIIVGDKYVVKSDDLNLENKKLMNKLERLILSKKDV